MRRLNISVIPICLVICFNYSFSSEASGQIPQINSSDMAKTSIPDEQDKIIIKLIKEGDLLYKQKKYNDAIKKYEEANKIKESADAYKGIGSANIQKAVELDNKKTITPTYREMQKYRYLELSVKSFLKASSLDPDNVEIANFLAEAYKLYNYSLTSRKNAFTGKKYSTDTAKTSVSDELDTTVVNLIKEGDILYEQRKYNDAIKKYEEANETRESADAYKGLGLAHIQKAKVLDQKMATPIRASLKQGYFESSAISFIKALGFEPENVEIKYLLADAFMFRNRRETDELAEPLLEQIVSTDKDYKAALIRLSLVYKRLEKFEKSRAALNEYLKMKKADSRTLYQLSKLAVEENKLFEAAKFFLQSLDNLTDEEAISEILEDLEILFSDKDKEEFRLAEHKGKFLKKFWLEKDPDPETEINERLIEHLRRVKTAKIYFSTQSLHGKYDDRGKIYIKYGPPDNKFASGGGMGVYSNESWIYYWGIGDYNDGLFFDFANKGGKGYESIRHLGEATYGIQLDDNGRTIDHMESYRRLYEERGELDEMIYGYAGRQRSSEPILDRILDFRDKKEIAYNNTPAEAYIFDTESQPLFVMSSSASFRGKNGKTRQELYYSFPLNQIKFKEVDKYKIAGIDEIVFLKNIDNKIIAQNNGKIEFKYEKEKNLKKNSCIGQFNFEIPSKNEDYISFLKIKSSLDNKLGLAYYDIKNKDYTGDSLIISDIQFSYNIVPSAEQSRFAKNGLLIIPHTGGMLDKNEDIFIYFEIYNLVLDASGDGRYNVEYIVRKRNPEDAEKKKYFNWLGKEVKNENFNLFGLFNEDFEKESITISRIETTRQRDTFTWLSFDIKELSEGLYDLTVKITDLVSRESTSSEYPFILGKE